MSDRGQPTGEAGKTDTSATTDGTSGDQSGNATSTRSDRPRVEFDDAQQAEVNRIAAKEADKAVRKAKADWDAEQQRVKDEAAGDFEKLLRQTEGTVSDLTIKLRVSEARSDVVNAAIGAGAAEPDGVWKLIKEDLQFDKDTGKATNVAELLAEAKQKYPRTFGAAKAPPPGGGGDGGDRGTPPGGNDMNQILRSAIRPGSAQAQQ